MIALTDCSPIVIAHEKGFFKKYGINSTIIKGASWAAIRDSLSNGDIQATHMLIGMPIASTMGLLGSPKKPMVIPWLLNRNGQAITLKAELQGQGRGRPEGAQAAGRRGEGGGHADDLRHDVPAGHARDVDALLPRPRAASIPTRTSRSITIPPPQMVANMKVGKMDGFCVGEPWNARADRRRHRLHRDHHAGHLEGPSGEGLRLHRGVRGEEPEDRQGRAQGAARGQRLARRPGEPPRAGRRSSRGRPTSTARRRSSSAACRATTTTATAARSRTRTT